MPILRASRRTILTGALVLAIASLPFVAWLVWFDAMFIAGDCISMARQIAQNSPANCAKESAWAHTVSSYWWAVVMAAEVFLLGSLMLVRLHKSFR